MRTFFIYDHFELYAVSDNFWKKGKHRHQFYELLYIKEGVGIHILNEIKMKSHPGDFYLMTPEDEHSFQALGHTEFYCFRFLPEFFMDESKDSRKMVEKLVSSMNTFNHTYGKLILKTQDRAIIVQLIHRIINEDKEHTFENRLLIKQSMLLILHLISKNVLSETNKKVLSTELLTIDNIIHYLRQHITEPDLIRKQIIADHFNVSIHYIGEYFIRHSGTSIREYISKLRLNIVKNKILHSKLSNEQIANNLGFKDQSHFYKFIKNQTGLSPTNYRKELISLSCVNP